MSAEVLERVGVPDDDGDSYARVGIGLAELHANNGEPQSVDAENPVTGEPREVLGGKALYGAVDYRTMTTSGIASIHGLNGRRHNIITMPQRYPVRGIGGIATSWVPRV